MTSRIATIDLGTNTLLLLIAERVDGVLKPVAERATITRLGKGVDATKRLDPARVEATCDCLRAYALLVREMGAVLVDAVGTSAMRDASGAEPIHETMRREFGLNLRTIGGREEAELTFLGATSGLSLSEVVVFDVGGGSTEFVRGRRAESGIKIESAISVDVGSVRMTERHLRGDPPTPESLKALDADLSTLFGAVTPTDAEVVGVAGTVTTLAAMSLELDAYDAARVHGHRLTRTSVEVLADRLRRATLEERTGFVGLQAGRADVIVAGAMIVAKALEKLGADSLIVSDRGVRWGLAERAVR